MRTGRLLGLGATTSLAAMIWLLGGRIYHEYRLTQTEVIVAVPPSDTVVRSVPLPPEPALAVPALEDLNAIADRPIFSQSRRPVQITEQASPTAPPPTLQIDLVGVVIWRAQRFALVRSQRDSTITRIGEGGKFEGWTAVGIGPERLLLRNGDNEQELRLSYKSPGSNG